MLTKDSPAPRRIQCRFCPWTTTAYITLKDGRRVPGMARLFKHIDDQHPDEFDAIYKDDHDWPDDPV